MNDIFSKPNRKKLYKKAWDKWGMEAQLGMLMEECAELIIATNKYSRFNKSSAQPARDLVEEIADVEIMIEQLKMQLDWENLEQRIETARHDKLLRLNNTLVNKKESSNG